MQIAVVMGSLSDLKKIEPMMEILKTFEVNVVPRCLSAHREHNELVAFVEETTKQGTEVIIAAAGMAAALPGVIAALTVVPVIGVPISCNNLDGLDALLSIVQMPTGVPVATVAIDGAKNAAYLALEILSIKYPNIKVKLEQERQKMREDALLANSKLQEKF